MQAPCENSLPIDVSKPLAPSASLLATYQRMRMLRLLRKPTILQSIIIGGRSVGFKTCEWVDYWGIVPKDLEAPVEKFFHTWESYILSGVHPSKIQPYVSAYFDLLSACLKAEPMDIPFLAKVLTFENLLFCFPDKPDGFAAATTSLRNPLFLSFHDQGRNPSGRDDANLLPLIAAGAGPFGLYYHYRKQRIFQNENLCLLVYPKVDKAQRAASFQGLERLPGLLTSDWDTSAVHRSELLSSKILIPYCETNLSAKSLRVLDIGSGDGQFSGQILGRLAQAGVLQDKKVELTLIDLVAPESTPQFLPQPLRPLLSKVERVSDDCFSWLADQIKSGTSRQIYDVAFLFRVLHHSSRFVIRETADGQDSENPGGKNNTELLSRYYQGLSRIFPSFAQKEAQAAKNRSLFRPTREFDSTVLFLSNGTSLLLGLSHLAKVVLIEDADLTAEILEDHLAKLGNGSLWVYDLSKALRLSRNHIYWVAGDAQSTPPLGVSIWPKSSG